MSEKIKKFLARRAQELSSNKEVVRHGSPLESLLALRFEDNHVQFHDTVDDRDTILLFASELCSIYNIKPKPAPEERPANQPSEAPAETDGKDSEAQKESPPTGTRRIVFSHKRALGDEVMFSAGVRDFCLLFPGIRVNVEGNHPALWENNPYLDTSFKKGDDGVEHYRVGYKAINSANNTYVHFSQMFLLDMVAVADFNQRLPMSLGEFCAAFGNGEIGDPCLGHPEKCREKGVEPRDFAISMVDKYRGFCKNFSRMRGDLHLTEEEKRTNIVRDLYGYEKYWVIAPGGKRDATCKIWDWRRFEDVARHFDGRIKFVTIGKGDLLTEGVRGTIDLVDRFNDDIRGLLSLVHNAQGCVSGASALMHLAAALPSEIEGKTYSKPCVTILGGREPTGWTWYTHHTILHTNGMFDCCAQGGCWRARTIPLMKDPKHNKNLCGHTVKDNGRTIQECMDNITAGDVIRAIERYYEGNVYDYMTTGEVKMAKTGQMKAKKTEAKPKAKRPKKKEPSSRPPDGPGVSSAAGVAQTEERAVANDKAAGSTPATRSRKNLSEKPINIIGNLNTAGGGEQSMLMIARLLKDDGWDVVVHPWGSVHKNYANPEVTVSDVNFKDDMGKTLAKKIRPGVPILFYANDSVNDFMRHCGPVVERSSMLIVGINYMLGDFKKPRHSGWLAESGKLRAVVFQNREKLDEWERQTTGFHGTEAIVLYGAIDLERFLEACPRQREGDDELVVLKHCMPDNRKYVTEQSRDSGEKIHVWQKHFFKELDTKFYERLLKDTKNTRFEFMEAHSELVNHFKDEPRMVFRKFDSMDVCEFLGGGHVYLYRTSNAWRDNYPRVVAEALAAGLPVLSEPRDGTADRVVHGDTGFYFCHYDEAIVHLKTLQRKENLRHAMGMRAKEWAKKNLDPRRWVEIVNRVTGNE